MCRNIETRYKALKTLVDTHALVSFGVSSYARQPSDGNDQGVEYFCQNFEFLAIAQVSSIYSSYDTDFSARLRCRHTA